MISRQFGPAGVGAYSYGYAVTSFVFVIGCLGIEEYGLREYARMEAGSRAQFIAELLGTQAMMLLAALAGLGIYLLLTHPTAATLVIVGSLTYYQVAMALAATLFIPAMGQQRMMGPALADLICRACGFILVGLTIHYLHRSISASMFGFTVSGTLLIVLAAQSAKRHGATLRISVSRHAMLKLGSVLWSFAAIEIFAQLFTRIGIIALSLRISEAAAGLYATGLRLTEVALMPLSFMGVAAYPRLSQLFRNDLTAFRRVSQSLLWLTLLALGAVSWGLYFVAPLLLVPVLGDRYAGAEPVVRTIAVLATVQACEIVMGRLLLAADLQVVRAASIVVGAVAALLLNLWLIPKFGVNGAIYAGALSYLVIDGLYVAALRRVLTDKSLSYWVTSFVMSVAVAITAAWLCTSYGSIAWAPGLMSALAFAAVAGGCFWFGPRNWFTPTAGSAIG